MRSSAQGARPWFVLNQLPDLDLDEASWGTPAEPEKNGLTRT